MVKMRTAMDALIAELHNCNGMITKSELYSLKSRALKLVELGRRQFDNYEAVRIHLDEHLGMADMELA